jgi:hypothetical protein
VELRQAEYSATIARRPRRQHEISIREIARRDGVSERAVQQQASPTFTQSSAATVMVTTRTRDPGGHGAGEKKFGPATVAGADEFCAINTGA